MMSHMEEFQSASEADAALNEGITAAGVADWFQSASEADAALNATLALAGSLNVSIRVRGGCSAELFKIRGTEAYEFQSASEADAALNDMTDAYLEYAGFQSASE